MRYSETMQSLRANRLFQDLTLQQLEVMSALMKKKKFPAGMTIAYQGELVTELYIIETGMLEVIKHNIESGNACSLATLIEGDCIGEMSMFNGQQACRSASIRTLMPTVLFVISIEDIQQLIVNESPYLKIFLNFAQQMSIKLRQTSEAAQQLLRYRKLLAEQSIFNPGEKLTEQEQMMLERAKQGHIFREVMLFREINPQSLIVIVSDDAMLPYYKMNDFVAGCIRRRKDLPSLINKLCIVEMPNNDILVRKLTKARKRDHYLLTPTNRLFAKQRLTVTRGDLVKVAEVIWHRRPNTQKRQA